jgi:uncharacterized membrane protein YciS (DUF1049 family)
MINVIAVMVGISNNDDTFYYENIIIHDIYYIYSITSISHICGIISCDNSFLHIKFNNISLTRQFCLIDLLPNEVC